MTAISTLTDIEGKLTTIRRDGNTTRVIDNAIQLLFKHGSISVQDHHLNDTAGKDIFLKILRRMKSEHPNVKLKTNMSIISIDNEDAELKGGTPHMFVDLNRTKL